jgi:membrane protease YdiL (CAAX protease family)
MLRSRTSCLSLCYPFRECAISLLARMFDIRRVRFPLAVVPLLLINPVLFAISLAIQRSLGVEVPLPGIRPFPALGLFCVFLVAAVCEELGWSGYALGPMQSRLGEVLAGLAIGLVWALWHFVPLAQAGQSIEELMPFNRGNVPGLDQRAMPSGVETRASRSHEESVAGHIATLAYFAVTGRSPASPGRQPTTRSGQSRRA